MSQRDQTELARRLLFEHSLNGLSQRLDHDVVDLPLEAQRRLSIVRMAASRSPLICIDEATVGLEDGEADRILGLIRKLSRRQGVLFVTRNKVHAQALGGVTALLAGGRIQEQNATVEFFLSPKTSVGESFVRTGNCSVPEPTAKKRDLAEGVELPPPLPRAARRAMKKSTGPTGFYWVKKDLLGGLPRPGMMNDLEDDLDAMKALGISVLITLEETRTVSAKLFNERGIQSLFLAIDDMGVPSIQQAEELCGEVEQLNAAGEVVAVHCRAGLGRTGTMLACQLIWEGATALEALDAVRAINHYWIQSAIQVEFLTEFADALDGKTRGPAAGV